MTMETNICCIFIFGAHYRTAIYQMMDKELGCDFYFGDNILIDNKRMDYNSLSGYKGSLKNVWLGNFYWQKGSVSLAFKPYKHIIMEGEPYCISSWFILLLAKITGKKTYPWTHGWYGRENWLKKVVKNLFFGLAHHILLYGDYARELMLKEGFSADKLSCIYNSLDYDNQLQIRNELQPETIYTDHFKNDVPNLMFVGRLTFAKRFDLLLNALFTLKEKLQIYNLTLIGDGEQKEELVKLAGKLGLEDNIWFYGACYDEKELSRLIYNADLCVSPGNVGLTAIHSLTFGTPVLTHDNFPYQGPEFEIIIDGVTGTYFEYDNCDSLTERIESWFSLKLDRNVIRNQCYKVIDAKYNPYYQMSVLKKVLLIENIKKGM